MRIVKMLGLAALSALAVMAVVGATGASADSLCLKDIAGPDATCPEGSIWTGSVKGHTVDPVTLKNGVATLLASGLEVKCESGFLADFVKNDGPKKGVLLLILELTFFNCGGDCTAVEGGKTTNPPYNAFASAERGHVVVTADGKGAPLAILTGCPFNVKCAYQAGASSLLKLT